jgi:uncharacterized protein (TIGR03032 family)
MECERLAERRNVEDHKRLAQPITAMPSEVRVDYRYSPSLFDILKHLKCSLIASTYQGGKVLAIGSVEDKLKISVLDCEQPMGLAVGRDVVAIGCRSQIQFFRAAHQIAPALSASGKADGCYVPNVSRHTGRILGHDLGWGEEGLWVVNTLFSCLCTLDDAHSFVPRWKPRFISQLADQDRCHLNGLAMDGGAPRYVTALAETDSAAGWRENKAKSGCLIDVTSGEVICRGLAMPHSPRVYQDKLWVLNSGQGQLSQVDRLTGKLTLVEDIPGYTRGLSFHGQFAFVGLSRIRESNVFGGLPISEKREELYCGIAVIDLLTGKTAATFRFLSGVEEIFAVDVIPGRLNPVLGGASSGETQQEIWVVPQNSALVPNSLGSGC